MAKKILIGVLVIVILIAGGIFYVASNLDGIVKDVVEEQGSKATGTQVTLGNVNVKLSAGSDLQCTDRGQSAGVQDRSRAHT